MVGPCGVDVFIPTVRNESISNIHSKGDLSFGEVII